MSTVNEASIVAVLGQSGQGKGVYTKARVYRDPPARCLIWDAMDEWGDFAPAFPTMTHIVGATARRGPRGFRFRYIPKAAAYSDSIKREFDAFCKIALAAKNCTLIAEELSFVTLPGWAPAGWSKVCNAGRHAGLKVIGISQAPAEIDKRFLGNATEIVSFYLGERAHRETVAAKLDCDPEHIKALAQFQFLHFVRSTRTVARGQVAPPGRAPQAATATGTGTDSPPSSQTTDARPQCAA